MSLISTLLVHAEPDLREALRFAFEREGIEVFAVDDAAVAETLAGARVQLVITGAAGNLEPVDVLDAVRAALDDAGLEAPVIHLGNGVPRDTALARGAAEVLDTPAFVRDVITIGRLLVAGVAADPAAARGQLGDHFGLFYLVRALSAARRRCVLTLIRGFRRGEIRLSEGQVTSAEVGGLHGLAALHQLLLWNEADFDLRPGEVGQRNQIPLEPAEVIADAARFLEEVRDVAPGISPAHVFDAVPDPPADITSSVPPPIEAVRRLFDGRRTVADVIEDSGLRVFETLRIADRLVAAGLIRRATSGHSRARASAPLPIEAWLAGTFAEAGPSIAPEAPASASRSGKRSGKKRKRKRKRGAAMAEPAASTRAIDWSDVMPDEASGGGEEVTQVVPASEASGEIEGPPASAPGEVEPPAADEPLVLIAQQHEASGPVQEMISGEIAALEPPRADDGAGERSIEVADEVIEEARRRPAPEAPATRRERKRAPGFTDAEEAFFRAGRELATSDPDPVESFEDLDEGCEARPSFWQRLFGHRRGRKARKRR
jgi:hypothetical protein